MSSSDDDDDGGGGWEFQDFDGGPDPDEEVADPVRIKFWTDQRREVKMGVLFV